MTYQIGQKVTCNGNPQGTVVGFYHGMVQVKLMSGTRNVGLVVVSTRCLDIENS